MEAGKQFGTVMWKTLQEVQNALPEEDVDTAVMATVLHDHMHFATIEETDDLRVWENGVYSVGGEARVRQMIEFLRPAWSATFKNEVIRHIKDKTLHKAADFELPPHLIPCANTIFDIEKNETVEYSPEIIFTKRLAFNYDPEAPYPKDFMEFLKSSQPDPEKRRRLLDHFASILDRRHIRRRALFNVGPPYSGKSTFLNVECAFLGEENYCNISLQEICRGRFSIAQLYDKALNSYSDVPEVEINPLDKFKKLTGGDHLNVEFKGRDSFTTWPYVKLHFAANAYPSVKKIDDPGFWVRWDLIRWEKTFNSEEDILPKLITPESLSGIAKILIPILIRQRKKGFVFVPSDAEAKETWLGDSEPARVFLPFAMMRDTNGLVSKVELFQAWDMWRVEHRYSKISETHFNRLVGEVFNAVEVRTRPKGMPRQLRCWSGITPRIGVSQLIDLRRISKNISNMSLLTETVENPSNPSQTTTAMIDEAMDKAMKEEAEEGQNKA